jgi:hypothetical protein
MKVCPYCEGTRYKSLLKGRIPRCCYNNEKKRLSALDLSPDERQGALEDFVDSHLVSTVKGKWYKRAPIYMVIAEFTILMQRSNQHGPDFFFHRDEYRTIYPGVITLLNRCDWDTSLAVEFLRVRFDRWFSNKRCHSIFYAIAASSFSVHLAEAKRRIELRQKAQYLQELAIEATAHETELDYVYATVDAM